MNQFKVYKGSLVKSIGSGRYYLILSEDEKVLYVNSVFNADYYSISLKRSYKDGNFPYRDFILIAK